MKTLRHHRTTRNKSTGALDGKGISVGGIPVGGSEIYPGRNWLSWRRFSLRNRLSGLRISGAKKARGSRSGRQVTDSRKGYIGSQRLAILRLLCPSILLAFPSRLCGLASGFSIFRLFCGDFALHLVLNILKIHIL